jgi:hypothetical protein
MQCDVEEGDLLLRCGAFEIGRRGFWCGAVTCATSSRGVQSYIYVCLWKPKLLVCLGRTGG